MGKIYAKIYVSYDGEPNKQLDKMIKEALETVGIKWYAQGYNFRTDRRDMAFEVFEYEDKG